MRLAFAIATAILAIGVSPAEAQDLGNPPTASKLLNDFTSAGEFEKAVSSVLINVAMNSFTIFNAELEYIGRPKLYCQPGEVSHEDEQLVRMMEAEVAKNPKVATAPFQSALLFGLMATYPCGDTDKH